MFYNNILFEVEEGILTITINRPETYNALSTETKAELTDAFEAANRDSEVKAIIITGAGSKAFSSGQDLNESKTVNQETADAWVDEFDKLYRVIRSIEKPIIASINGFATGSGLQLALLADIRIAAKSAKFGMTEINVGLPCIIGSTMFWETMGRTKTIDLILTGQLLKAEEAKDYDLITRVVDDNELKEKSRDLAKELAAKPPIGIAVNKRWFKQLGDENFDNCMDYAIKAHTIAYESGEPQQAMTEFFEKRAAKKG
ncbi:enoyl-CoA hydratase/carnithine racemase [Scopulibacillus darangshiensis]|uniref:Enoyl-CoA hydratase/carnithine racemase n=1 Tax=Scopulibacillus darangshiensis TaxID=442528 RepID=A0A4R2NJJ4_9BACL|nr:enoyl-CoA hydratase/isomerase family protein [Scopulibacillus darangshiensis]TCP21294.1 enoyl-CoA hydratase/carnithine racemase [Scopulibacillus darangshiensis]